MTTRVPCPRPLCPWHLAAGQLFCGLCGRRAAELEVVHAERTLEGLLFRVGSGRAQPQSVVLVSTGIVPVSYTATCTSGFRVGSGSENAPLRSMEGTLQPQRRTELWLAPHGRLPGANETLQISSLGLQGGSIDVALTADTKPIWDLTYDGRSTARERAQELPVLYPPESMRDGCKWSFELVAREGSAIVTSMRLAPLEAEEDATAESAALDAVEPEAPTQKPRIFLPGLGTAMEDPSSDRDDTMGSSIGVQRPTAKLKLHEPTLPILVKNGGRLPLQVEWIQPGADPIPVRLTLHTRDDEPTVFTLRLSARPPVRLNVDLESPRPSSQTPLFTGGSRPVRAQFRLSNAGARPARLKRLVINTPCVYLAEALVVDQSGASTTWPCASPGQTSQVASLPALVQQAFIEGVLPEEETEQEITTLSSLVLGVEPDAQPSEGALRLSLTAVLDVLDGEQVQREVKLDIPARPIRVLDPSKGMALVDYGTVHSCVRLVVQDAASETRWITVDLEDPGASQRTQMKSAYRVLEWTSSSGAPEFTFGYKVWDDLHADFRRNDWAAKLRLGTSRKRGLWDSGDVFHEVSGTDAAEILLREALHRTEESTGFRPELIWMTHPAAFRDAANQDLLAALTRLGYGNRVQLRCTEPEAYLCSLASDAEFGRRLAGLHENDDDPRPLLGFVFDFGGGTTDVTIFQHMSFAGVGQEFEIVASHGYRSLGGESLTLHLAAHLFATIQSDALLPFPTMPPDTPFQPEQLDAANAPLIHNFSEMRHLAERIKCKSEWPGSEQHIVTLMDVDGRPVACTVKAEAGDRSRGMRGVCWAQVAAAVDDIMARIVRMDTFGIVERGVPQIVAVAGNSGRLNCLQDIISTALDEAGLKDYEYHFDEARAKVGVVEGLEVYRRPGPNIIRVRNAASAVWWYIRMATDYLLLMPAGAIQRPAPTDQDLHSPIPPFATWEFCELFTGPGPEERLSAAEGAHLRLSVRVSPPAELCGRFVEAAIGFADDGSPGLWFRNAPGGTKWTWCLGEAVD